VKCLINHFFTMAKVSFYLTDKNAKDETKLFAFINYVLFVYDENGKKKYLPLKYTTNIEVIPALWDNKKNRVKESLKWAQPETFEISKFAVEESARKKYESINSEIVLFEQSAKDIVSKLTVNGRLPRHEQVRKELDRIYNPKRLIGSLEQINYHSFDLVQFIDHIVNTSTNLRNSTKKNYKVVKKNVEDYQKKYKGTITPQNADIDFYNSFVKFLTSAGLSKNTIGTRIKIIKAVLNYANERIDNVCQDYKKESFAKPSEETESVYLTQDELNSISNLKYLPPYLEKVRDMFIIGCDTGLRFSDLSRLTKDNINSDNTISIKTQKTGKVVVIPMTPRVKTIFEKYNYVLPDSISNQKYNEYLKDIARRANLKEPISTTRTIKGMLVTRTVEKWELVTSHTARRSFATNAFLADVPAIAIMKITGHKTESAFMKYIKMTAKDNAIKLQSHKFFTQLTPIAK
jgi:integrase